MAFCENCGKSLAEGEVCNCTAAPEETRKAGLIFIIALALVIVILAVVLIVILISNDDSEKKDKKSDEKKEEVKSSYMDPLEDLMKLVNRREVDAVALDNVFLPDFVAKKYKKTVDCLEQSGSFQDELESRNDELEYYYEYCDGEFGDWKISFKETETLKMEESDLKEYKDEIEDCYDDGLEDVQDVLEDMLEYDDEIENYADFYEMTPEQTKKFFEAWASYLEEYEELKVTEGYTINGRFVLKSGNDEYEGSDISLDVVKVNGSWVYMGLEGYVIPYFEEDEHNCLCFFFNYLLDSHLYIDSWY